MRTFAQQVKHVAAVNYILKAPAETGGESRSESVTTKADMVKYLRACFEYANKAIAILKEKNSLEPVQSPFGEGTRTRLASPASSPLWLSVATGKMVVYLRSNGIQPAGKFASTLRGEPAARGFFPKASSI